MIPLKKAFSSTVGRKFIMAITGLALVLFTIVHLLGNLPLLSSDGTTFNKYANTLESLGGLLYFAEISLVFLAVIHIFLAIWLKATAVAARPMTYVQAHSKMGPSKWGFASRNLIVTGLVILIFLMVHIYQFKFGPGIKEGYAVQIQGETVRDLYRWVRESFHNPLIVIFYVLSMIFLGFHLKHGFWSGFQSLGATNKRNSNSIFYLGLLFSAFIGIGFLMIPIIIFFSAPGGSP